MNQLLTENQKKALVPLENQYRLEIRLKIAYAGEKRGCIKEELERNIRQIETSISSLEQKINLDKITINQAKKKAYRDESKYILRSDDVSKTEKDYAWKIMQRLCHE